ncbi:MAG: hypothetical protein KDB14_33070 [Planctomycetales bacterium]|nr:hypothetical protein [Planctomycetales bacterium]
MQMKCWGAGVAAVCWMAGAVAAQTTLLPSTPSVGGTLYRPMPPASVPPLIQAETAERVPFAPSSSAGTKAPLLLPAAPDDLPSYRPRDAAPPGRRDVATAPQPSAPLMLSPHQAPPLPLATKSDLPSFPRSGGTSSLSPDVDATNTGPTESAFPSVETSPEFPSDQEQWVVPAPVVQNTPSRRESLNAGEPIPPPQPTPVEPMTEDETVHPRSSENNDAEFNPFLSSDESAAPEVTNNWLPPVVNPEDLPREEPEDPLALPEPPPVHVDEGLAAELRAEVPQPLTRDTAEPLRSIGGRNKFGIPDDRDRWRYAWNAGRADSAQPEEADTHGPELRDLTSRPLSANIDINETLPPDVSRSQAGSPFVGAESRAPEIFEPESCEVAQGFMWVAPGTMHQPLYFEDVNLERAGHSWLWLQPAASAAHFFGRIPALPYLLVAHPPRECVYTLGHYRPGSCAPMLRRWPRPRLSAALAQAGLSTGLVFLVP